MKSLILTAMLALSCSVASAEPFESTGATVAGSRYAFLPLSLAEGVSDSSSLQVGASWDRYGLRETYSVRARPGFWGSMLYGTLGATVEGVVMDVSSPEQFNIGYWPRSSTRSALYAWRSDPALRAYLMPAVSSGRVNMRKVSTPTHHLE